MTPKAFKQDMHRGLGRCYLELKNSNDPEKYRDTVLWGCLHVMAFDTQCEGTRAAYLYNLISLLPDRAYFADRIAEKYRAFSGRDTWFFQQLTELLSFFAEDGNQTAKDSLSEKYAALYGCLLKKRHFNGYDYQRDNFELLSIVFFGSREKTFEELISDYGTLFLKNRHYGLTGWFDWFASSLEEAVGKEKLAEELKKHEDIPAWKCFSDSYLREENQKQERRNSKRAALPAEELFDASDGNQKRLRFETLAFSHSAADSEKKKLADFIEAEPSPEKKAGLLQAFWNENYPGNHKVLIEYVNSDCDALSAAAKETLSSCQSETVYRYAKACLQNDRCDDTAISILLLNYREEDKERLLAALSDLRIDDTSESGWHGVAQQILKVEDRGVHLPRDFFAWIYEKSLCSCCRYSAVRRMGERRWLSPQMIAECEYDSNADIVSYINGGDENGR